MNRRDLLLANLLGVLIALGALIAGWGEAAAFGLAVLAVLDLFVWLRGRQAHSEADNKAQEDEHTDS